MPEGLHLGFRRSFSTALAPLDQETGQLLSVTAEIGLLATSCRVPDSQEEVDSLPSSETNAIEEPFFCSFV